MSGTPTQRVCFPFKSVGSFWRFVVHPCCTARFRITPDAKFWVGLSGVSWKTILLQRRPTAKSAVVRRELGLKTLDESASVSLVKTRVKADTTSTRGGCCLRPPLVKSVVALLETIQRLRKGGMDYRVFSRATLASI